MASSGDETDKTRLLRILTASSLILEAIKEKMAKLDVVDQALKATRANVEEALMSGDISSITMHTTRLMTLTRECEDLMTSVRELKASLGRT